MRFKHNLSEEEYESKNRELYGRIDNGEALDKEETAFVCHTMRFDRLLHYSPCLDEYFTRVFLARNSELPESMIELHERDHIYYEGLIREWESIITKTNHTDQLVQITAKETREELKKFNRGYSLFVPNHSPQDYQDRKFKIYEWSKYRYIMIKDIFDLIIKNTEFKLSLNDKEIIFNYFSLTHILTRHYGHIMKPYDTDKSHFTKDIHHEEIHLKLEEIFGLIDNSGHYKNNSVEDITIRYNGTLYKIYCKEAYKGRVKFMRLSTFFPIEHQDLLNELDKKYEEIIISESLNIFIKKGSSSAVVV